MAAWVVRHGGRCYVGFGPGPAGLVRAKKFATGRTGAVIQLISAAERAALKGWVLANMRFI